MKHRLLAFDYDGPITVGNPAAVESMRQGLQQTLEEYRSKLTQTHHFREYVFQEAMAKSSGTTEFNFILKYLIEDGIVKNLENTSISPEQQEKWSFIFRFFEEFLVNRTNFFIKDNEERGVSGSDEGYIVPDFFDLINKIRAQDLQYGIETDFAIVTGNPGWVMRARLPESVKDLIKVLETGDSGLHRGVLLESCVGSWRYRYKIPKDSKDQVFYFDDSMRGIRDASFFYGWSENRQVEKFDPSIHLIHINRNDPEYAAMGGGVFTCGSLDDQRLHRFLLRENPLQLEFENQISKLESNRRPVFRKIEA